MLGQSHPQASRSLAKTCGLAVPYSHVKLITKWDVESTPKLCQSQRALDLATGESKSEQLQEKEREKKERYKDTSMWLLMGIGACLTCGHWFHL